VRRFSLLFGICLASTACQDFLGTEFPEQAVAISPPAHFRVWWEVIESCTGRRVPFSAIDWYKTDWLTVRGDHAGGVWYEKGNRIVMANSYIGDGFVVRHEMLHAILGMGAHPPDMFRVACADEVACGRGCRDSTALSESVEIAVDQLQVKADFFPASPSISEHGQRAVVVVHVRNPTIRKVFVPASRFAQSGCAVGFQISSTKLDRVEQRCRYLNYHPGDGRVYFTPGENRRMVFEVDLSIHMNGLASVGPEPVTVSAVLLDNLRDSRSVTVLP
jgi:hypothetical protein